MSGSAMDGLFGMARSLAKPVCRGYLSHAQADASLITATLRAERAETIAPYRAGNIITMLRWTLDTWIEREESRRSLTAHRIEQALKPMIARRQPWRDLIIEAHEANGRDDFPLTEEEAAEVVETEVWFALPPPPREMRRARHG